MPFGKAQDDHDEEEKGYKSLHILESVWKTFFFCKSERSYSVELVLVITDPFLIMGVAVQNIRVIT